MNKYTMKYGIGAIVIGVLVSASYICAQEINAAKYPVFTIDAAKRTGNLKPINGVNGGPRISLGGTYDNTEYFNAFKPPFIRTHDVPFAAEEAVDIHYIFPNFDADENDPKNYNSDKTDRYIKSILDCGSKVLFRLGESIEWAGDPVNFPQRHVHPPKDFDKWARICCNVIRHYNMGWADGHKWDIKYWEIWNEYNSKGQWTGTPLQFYQMYEAAAREIKKLDPTLKVGGPALCVSIGSQEGRRFLGYCRDRKVPLDFVSWHGYGKHPGHVIANVEQGIAAVKEFGFTEAETALDEWNYQPLRWGLKDRQYKYKHGFSKTMGPEGAAFTASVLSYLQDSELDISCYYAAFGSIFRFGFFDKYGIPQKPFYTFVAYNELMKRGKQVAASGANRQTGLAITAATDEKTGTTTVLLSNFDDANSRFVLDMKNLPVSGNVFCSEYVLDKTRSLDWDREQVFSSGDFQMVVELPKYSVRLLLFTPQSRNRKPLCVLGEADREKDRKFLGK